MKKDQKGFTAVIIALILVIIVVILALGLYIAHRQGLVVTDKSGVDIEIITGEGGMPPDTSTGEPLTGERFTVVFTEPFKSLENWHDSKELKEVSTTTGEAKLDLSAGKYGVYYIYKGQKTLYGDLTLDNPRNDIQRDKQGPWYIKVNNLQRTKLKFSINSLPS